MKKAAVVIISILVLVLISLGIVYAVSKNQNQKNETANGKKTLVAYFSATGTTKQKAQLLSEAIGADIYEIKPKIPYTDADLDWKNKNSRSSIENGR